MIKFAGQDADIKALEAQYPSVGPEAQILRQLAKSDTIYSYESTEELAFEIAMRKSIINAALMLYKGRLGFRTFHESKCNEEFWVRREDGGFTLKKGVKPSDAVRDIFRNTRKYATECATAIMMTFYKAVLDVYPEETFNSAFSEITLMDWMEQDDLMGVTTTRKITDYLPGDCRYFRNPDVNPLTPEWQGENTIMLGSDSYYGHGIGLGDADRIIATLNENRIDGAQASAYLMNNATRPDFKSLYRYKKNFVQAPSSPLT